MFKNNSAPYGNDMASYAVKVSITSLDNVGSGVKLSEDFVVTVLDNDDQVMNEAHGVSLKLIPSNNDLKISGIVSVKLESGVATFTNLIFTSTPGATFVPFKVSSPLLDTKRIAAGADLGGITLSEALQATVSFRFCQPGEIQNDNICSE